VKTLERRKRRVIFKKKRNKKPEMQGNVSDPYFVVRTINKMMGTMAMVCESKLGGQVG
jgi:hypothetical protein